MKSYSICESMCENVNRPEGQEIPLGDVREESVGRSRLAASEGGPV